MPRRARPEVPVLTDGEVTLRGHTEDDLADLVTFGSDLDMQRWTTVPRGYGREHAQGWIDHVREQWAEPGGQRSWAIEYRDTDGRSHFGGNVDLRPRGDGTATIGFGLHPAARGRSVMSRAVRLACRHGFEHGLAGRDLVRVHWEAVAGNFASWRVAWATGFTFHGTVPDGIEQPGTGLSDLWQASLGAADEMEPSAPWHEAVVIELDGIRLRPWRSGDATSMEEPDHPAHHMPSGAAATQDTFAAWLLARQVRMATGTGITWCIADRTSDAPLGAVMLFEHDQPMVPPSAEIGYWLLPSARGRGAATTAARAVTRFAFAAADRGLGMHRLHAVTAADNHASIGVLTRCGFVICGTEHETDRLPDGSWADALRWELLNHPARP